MRLPVDNPGIDMTTLVEMLELRLNAERARRKKLEIQLAVREAQSGGGGQDPAALTERLEQLIAERTRALRLARDEAIAASHSKSSFLANMSHEIRTPLTSIIGFAEMLQDPQADKTGAAKTIVRNGRHLLEVINDILDLSKIESKQLALERIDVGLPRLLSDVEALASSRAQDKSLLFSIVRHLPLPPVLSTDPVRLKQILLNFCSNAIKFSAEGEVRLDVHHETVHNRLRFEVSDTGIGMSAEEIGRLFKPFAQADVSTTRKFGGTGLGLYICKQLADMLGGEIRVASRPGKGSRFTLTIPVVRVAKPMEMLDDHRDFDDFQRPAFQITAVQVPVLSGRVLVAEDGADNQRLLATYLRRAGLEFDLVGNGREAVERALGHPYALVLMDIQMPVMDGVTATRALRAASYRGPIVALTANVMHDDVTLYRKAGCNDVLAKPIDRARFYAVLQAQLGTEVTLGVEAEDAYGHELAQLTAEYEAGLPAALQRIEHAASRRDWKTLAGLLHSLKGSAGSHGFDAITDMAGEIEARLRAGRFEAAIGLCGDMARQFGPARR